MDLPDFSVIVPGTEVALEILGVALHTLADHSLYLLGFFITGDNLVDRLEKRLQIQ